MRTGLLLYNPISGAQSIPKILDELVAYGQDSGLALIPFRLQLSPDNHTLLTQLIRSSWIDFVIASGGDGTLGAVAQMLLSYRPEMPLGVIPSGTCNDFALSLRLPQDIWDCINVVAENHTASFDVGRVNGERIFLSSCAAGMFVNISYSISSQLKKALGPIAYYFSALGELPRIRSFPLRVETESDVIEDDFLLFLLLNGSQAAGLANLNSNARMRDGNMELLLIKAVPTIDLPYLFAELLSGASNDETRWLHRLRARHFTFASPQTLITTQDGEEGLPLPLDVEVLKQALTVFVRKTND